MWSAVVEAPRVIDQTMGLAGPGVPAVLGWSAVAAGLVARRIRATPRAGALAALGPLVVSGLSPSEPIVMVALVVAGLAGGWMVGAVCGRAEELSPTGAGAGLNLLAAASGIVLIPLSPLWTAALVAVVITSELAGATDEKRSAPEVRPVVVDPTATLETIGLALAFGPREVLRGVDLQLRPGELVALVGGNGSGKSTLLRVLAGQLLADRGSLLLDGQEATGASPEELVRRGVALASGSRPVFPDLSVRQNLQIATWVSTDRHRRPALVAGALEQFPELLPLADAAAGTLSGGEQRILALAASLLSRPRILLADEITLGLSPRARTRALRTLRSTADAGATVVVVEHELRDVLPLADRLLLIEDGVLREVDELQLSPARFIPEGPA